MTDKTQINQVDPTTFEFQQYTEQDNVLISSSRLDTAFSSSTDYIEYYAYDENKNLIFPLWGLSDVPMPPETDMNYLLGNQNTPMNSTMFL